MNTSNVFHILTNKTGKNLYDLVDKENYRP